jgi:hypothetical protein
MNRRQFLGLSCIAAAVWMVPASHHPGVVPRYACTADGIPRKAIIGDCFVLTRGTYAGWLRPGCPVDYLDV